MCSAFCSTRLAPANCTGPIFDHVASDRDHLERILSGALQSDKRGVNVLVYGPPGTGKTEFCKTLAARREPRQEHRDAVVGVETEVQARRAGHIVRVPKPGLVCIHKTRTLVGEARGAVSRPAAPGWPWRFHADVTISASWYC